MTEQAYIRARNNVTFKGQGTQTLLLAHGFGCNQLMWRLLEPLLAPHFQLVLFDYVGSGAGSMADYSRERYASLDGYAQDITEIIDAFGLTDVVLVGHSVSSMIGLLAARQRPQAFRSLVMVCPSPCFLNMPPDYFGGFEHSDLNELIDLMDKNYIGWAHYLAPLVSGAPTEDATSTELIDSFCSTNPITAKTFAKATFFSDHRPLLPDNQHPVLILQSERDALAAQEIGVYMQQQMPHSQLQLIAAKGHCLHMTHPAAVAQALQQFLQSQPSHD